MTVGTGITAWDWPAGSVRVSSPSLPAETMSPVSDTLIRTRSAAVVSPVRVIVNSAAGSPSFTGVFLAATVTEGGTIAVAALVKVASWPSLSVTVTLTFSVVPPSADTGT